MTDTLKKQIEVSKWAGIIYMDRTLDDHPVLKIYLKRFYDIGELRESEVFISDEDAAELRLAETKEKYSIGIVEYSNLK